ncbi:ABC transporter ATP-binding protein [Treponema sp. Marseille-Q4130]|nr:ABC transporter ATP-binding protein [Treponema sp. Marseille-Q4130]
MITLDHICYAYPQSSKENLNDITMEIQDGEAVALIGLSGCGKTTITRILNGLAYKFFSGKMDGCISINGIDPSKKELHEIGRMIGSIFQNPKSQFFAEVVEDEIAFGLENYGFERTEIVKRITDSLRMINGETLRTRNLFQLSSGERQKVAIASVNALDPPVYVFDEPSANLDMASVEALKRLMALLKKKGKTLIVSEHRIYYLKDIIDRYYYIEDGKIIRCYTKEMLEHSPIEFFRQQGLRLCSLDRIEPHGKTMSGTQCLKIDNLSFSYSRQSLLENLNYCFTSGIIYGIIGGNGAGKSTFAKVLSGLLREKHGSISSCGKYSCNDIKLNCRTRRKTIYYLSNNLDSNLFEVSATEELRLNDPAADAAEILKDYCLDSVANTHPQILSGGQKQRLAIAAASLLKRDVYIFDEPTSGLDGKNMRLIAGKMRELQEHDRIVIVISHDYEFLMEVCSVVLHLKGKSFTEYTVATDKEKILNVLQKE